MDNVVDIERTRTVKVDRLKKIGKKMDRFIESKADGQYILGTDERVFLKSRIRTDILIPGRQPVEVGSTVQNILDTQITPYTVKSGSGKLSQSKFTVRLGKKQSRLYVSIFGAQEWQGYQLQDNDEHPRQQGNDKNSIKHREDEDPSLAAGINIGYQIGKKISIETGLRFGGYHIRTDSAKIFAENNNGDIEYKLNTSSGYAYFNSVGGILPSIGDSLNAQKVMQTINYVGIPILLRYKIGYGKLTFNPALGVVFNFITKSTVSADLKGGLGNDLQHVNLKGLTNFSAVVTFNPSIYYKVGHKISVGLEPYFNYSITPINNTNVVKSYPYGLGLGAGIKYSF